MGTSKHGKAPRRKKDGSKAAGGRPAPIKATGAVIALALLAAVVASGILVVHNAHQVRQLHQELEAVRHGEDQLLVEHSRLLLERGALSAYANVERTAATELGMRFPRQVQRISR